MVFMRIVSPCTAGIRTTFIRMICSMMLLVSAAAARNLAAMEAPSFSASPFFEAARGNALEYVYYNDKFLSELIWDMKPMLSAGMKAGAEWRNGLTVSVEGSLAAPMNTGIMEDSDWFNLYYYNQDTEKTNFSRHEAELLYGGSLEALIGKTFKAGGGGKRDISVTPALGIRYYRWKWDANDGYTQYASDSGAYVWSENLPKTPISGTGISYEQQYLIPIAAVRADLSFSTNLKISTSVALSPWLYCYSIDNHHLTGYDYHDIMTGGYLLEPALAVEWTASPKVVPFLSLKWTQIGGLRGKTGEINTAANTISWSYAEDGAGPGAGLETAVFRAGVAFALN